MPPATGHLPRVLVTRPAREAAQWVQALQARGWSAVALPLIEIGSPTQLDALEHCRQRWSAYQALMFVSAQAVAYFFPEGGWSGLPPWQGTDASAQPPRFWAPGPGTARALLRHGVPEDWIDTPAAQAAQFDSEALWAQVGSQVRVGARLLIVRGESVGAGRAGVATGNGRDWLARQWEAAGGRVDWCVAYRRQAPWLDQTALALAQEAANDGSLWLFSSSEAIDYLAQALPAADWSRARALVTHPRIAETAGALGFGDVKITRPALPDVLHSLESMA